MFPNPDEPKIEIGERKEKSTRTGRKKEKIEELGCKLSDSITPSCSAAGTNGAEKKAVNSVTMETAGNSEETRKIDEENMRKKNQEKNGKRNDDEVVMAEEGNYSTSTLSVLH